MRAHCLVIVLAAKALACAPSPDVAARAPVPSARSAPTFSPRASSAVPVASAPEKRRGSVGSAHPVVLEAASALKSWAVVCQARSDSDHDGRVEVAIGAHGRLAGDTLASYLVLGAGEGERIDELAAHDPLGRWLVVRRGERLDLVDAKSGVQSELGGADARGDRSPYRSHRAVSFDALGKRLAWVRGASPHRRVVVRELETGAETEIDPGPGELWRVELSADGNWVVLQMVPEDTNKNGRLDWPVPPGEGQWRCQGPLQRFDAWLARGDAIAVAIAPTFAGSARPVPGFVLPFGRDFVVRDAIGQLFLQKAGDKPVFGGLLSSDKCGARVFDADAIRGLLLVACVGSSPAGRPELMLVGPGVRQLLGVRVAPFTHDRDPGPPHRLVPVYSGRDTLLVDFEARRVKTLRPDDLVVRVDDALALIRRSDSLLIYDAARGSEQTLPGRVSPRAEPVTDSGAPSIAAVAPLIADLRRRAVLGTYTGRALAVAADGAVLVAQGGDPSAERLAVGPLSWRAPIPLAGATPVSAASAAP